MLRLLTRKLQHRFNRSHRLEKTDNCKTDAKPNGSKLISQQVSSCKIIQDLLPCTLQSLNSNILACRNLYERQRKQYEDTTSKIREQRILEAFGWSGALAFGWVISKQLWSKQKWLWEEEKNNKYQKGLIELLSHVVKTQPPVSFVLPQIKSVTTSTPKKDEFQSSESNLEEELDKAAQELLMVHERVIGEALNRRGIACLSSKSTGAEAIKYFERASDMKYPPASFNMGQCCELGIGTKQDFKQAAEWYRVASEQGHATAMYNLGVFHAHGWGGLSADIDSAKKLFLKAAKLGQRDAIAALDKESKFQSFFKTSRPTASSQSQFTIDTRPSSLVANENFFIPQSKNGSNTGAFNRSFCSDTNWNIALNSALAF